MFLPFNIDRHSGQHTTTLPTSMFRNGEERGKKSQVKLGCEGVTNWTGHILR